jgi:HAD superfamily hydrolase (TIGR01459 family)
MKHIKGLAEIIDQYSLFLIDIGGVIHDGLAPYPHAIDALSYLQAQGKNVTLFSNAPRRAEGTKARIAGFGHTFKDEKILTSGEFFRDTMHQLEGHRAYVLGGSKNTDLSLAYRFQLVDDIKDAEYLIFLEYLEASEDLDQHDTLLADAHRNRITGICPNPDAIVNHGNQLRHPAGYFANKYEKIGGKVIYFGKPYAPFYDAALAMTPTEKSQVLAIGDNLDTDILGANQYGIDCLLVGCGLYKDLAPLTNGNRNPYYPTYFCDYLR